MLNRVCLQASGGVRRARLGARLHERRADLARRRFSCRPLHRRRPGAAEMTALRVRYDARDLESAVGARRLLGRIGAAAQEVCGASSFSLPEVKAAVRASQCWRKSVDDAVGSIDSPLLNAAARGKAALTRLEEPGRQMDAWLDEGIILRACARSPMAHYPTKRRPVLAGRRQAAGRLPAAWRGFWRLPWGRDNIAPIAVDLMRRGLALYGIWSIGAWQGTSVCRATNAWRRRAPTGQTRAYRQTG